jgi:hypothetical protein
MVLMGVPSQFVIPAKAGTQARGTVFAATDTR